MPLASCRCDGVTVHISNPAKKTPRTMLGCQERRGLQCGFKSSTVQRTHINAHPYTVTRRGSGNPLSHEEVPRSGSSVGCLRHKMETAVVISMIQVLYLCMHSFWKYWFSSVHFERVEIPSHAFPWLQQLSGKGESKEKGLIIRYYLKN